MMWTDLISLLYMAWVIMNQSNEVLCIVVFGPGPCPEVPNYDDDRMLWWWWWYDDNIMMMIWLVLPSGDLSPDDPSNESTIITSGPCVLHIHHVIIQPCIVNFVAIAILTIEMSTYKASGARGDLSPNGPSIITEDLSTTLLHYIQS